MSMTVSKLQFDLSQTSQACPPRSAGVRAVLVAWMIAQASAGRARRQERLNQRVTAELTDYLCRDIGLLPAPTQHGVSRWC